MNENPPQLSPKSLRVLQFIAAGHSYAQIVDHHADPNYHDIFHAAEEAVWLQERLNANNKKESSVARPTDVSAMERAKLKHPRAYAPWTESEDAELRSMYAAGMKNQQIAEHFQRQPSAIKSRIKKLGLDQK